MRYLLFGLLLGYLLPQALPAQPRILFFVSHEDTYYSEYVVAYRALLASGYAVEVRSAGAQHASTYMLPNGTDIAATAGTLPGSNYTQFTTQYQQLFGAAWDAGWDATPAQIPVDGRIQDVVDMSAYDGLVIAGGTGVLAYRVDGSYAAQGAGARMLSAADVEAAALKLQALALEGLAAGKPVLAQCHGASLPAFWRVPGTAGQGPGGLGRSLLDGQPAAGYPETETGTALGDLNVTYRDQDKVVVASHATEWTDGAAAAGRILTSRDWYPQTVAFATRAFRNVLRTYPAHSQLTPNRNVLILHGGAVDPNNCAASNLANDVPCNYGGGNDLPADYTHLQSLLQADNPHDPYQFTVSHLNLTGTLPFDPQQEAAVLAYLQDFDVVVFYKHWSTGMTTPLQDALVSYAAQGGGVLAVHHGIYNHINGSQNKDILMTQLFGVQSAFAGWSGNRTTYNAFSTNYGHFVSTYGVQYTAAPLAAPSGWNTQALPSAANPSLSLLPRLSVFDELYNNMAFVGTPTFGFGLNEVQPLFSNDQTPASQSHTTAMVKRFATPGSNTEGRVGVIQIGERPEHYLPNGAVGQVLRNAVTWLALADNTTPTAREGAQAPDALVSFPNPLSVGGTLHLRMQQPTTVCLTNSLGQRLLETTLPAGTHALPTQSWQPGLYLLQSPQHPGATRRVVVQ